MAIRVLGAGIGVLFLVGSARAGTGFTNFVECPNPLATPVNVFNTIVADASFSFGTLSVKVCNGITNKAVNTCKEQVKAAAKCNEKSVDSLYDIVIKQCEQLSDPTDRSNCKAGTKANRDLVKTDNKLNRDSALSECDGEFDAAMQNDCVNGVP